MVQGKNAKQPLQGSSEAAARCSLTPQEQQPLLVIHVDVENALITTSRYAKDATSAAGGVMLVTSARRHASHLLAEAAWGTIDPESGEWALEGETTLEDEGMTFGDFLRNSYKHSARQTSDAEKVEQRLQTFGYEVKTTRRTRKSSCGPPGDAGEAAAVALRDGHRLLMKRLMLPPTVCMALGCETPDPNAVLGLEGNAGTDACNKDRWGSGGELTLPQQLKAGYWQLAPSFLSLLFSLAKARRAFRLVLHSRHPLRSAATEAIVHEFNAVCEGKHPAFNGAHRTKQVFLDGTHGSPDLRISKEAVGVMHVPQSLSFSKSKDNSRGSSPEDTPRMVIPAANSCYVGAQQIYAGLMYRELAENKAVFIVHQPMPSGSSSLNANFPVDLKTQGTGFSTEVIAGAAGVDGCETRVSVEHAGEAIQNKLPLTCPLTIWADAQDLTHFHVCLSASGIPTVFDGVCFFPTLLPVDVVTRQPLTLQRGFVGECNDRDKPKSQPLVTFQTFCWTRGSLEYGAVACRVSPSPWECLTNADCLMEAISVCEKQRQQLAVAAHKFNEEQLISRGNEATSGEGNRVANGGESVTEAPNLGCALELPGISSYQSIPEERLLLPASDAAYLKETIVPVLYPALEAVLRDRPEDPLAALAFYLLRHSAGYSFTSLPRILEADAVCAQPRDY